MKWKTRIVKSNSGRQLYVSTLEIIPSGLAVTIRQKECQEHGNIIKVRWYLICLYLGIDYIDLSEGINITQAKEEALVLIKKKIKKYNNAIEMLSI